MPVRLHEPAAILAVCAFGALGVGCPAEAPPPPESPAPEDQCLRDTNKVLPAGVAAIVNGTRQPSLVPLHAAQQDAVVAIADAHFVQDGSFCSGTLITEDVVLTAQHCTDGYGNDELAVLFGWDEFAPKLVVPSLEVREHPSLDIALIKLAFAPGTQIPVTPIPAALGPPDDDQIGSLVENAGYGDTDDGSEGRYFVTEIYRGVALSEFILVDGEGRRGVCFGDSGGPSLHVSAQGDVRTLGALSFGDDPCGSTDYYQRVDTVLAWVEELTGPTPRGDVEVCGNDVSEEGRCSAEQTAVEYCEAGIVVRDACGSDEICAAIETLEGARVFRCLPTAANPCRDVSTFGRCDGDTLVWCDDGVVKERVCGDCDGRCLLASETFGFACVPSDCGGVDETGVCDGSVARWCDGVTLQEEDCADYGQRCEYVGPIFGYYCYDEEACGGLDWTGTCEGDVVHWCQDGEPSSYDCAADGQTCGYVEDEEGFNCVDRPG